MKTETHLLFGRELREPMDNVLPPLTGCRGADVTSVDDPAFSALNALYEAHGFGKQWTTAMLQRGARAVVALLPNAAAAAWSTDRPLYVSEIRRTFSPGGGAYFFGDLVDEPYRGHRLQRWLIHQRLRAAQQRGSATAFALVSDDNPPSLKSYSSENFAVGWRLKTWRLGALRLDRLLPLAGALQTAPLFSTEGVRLTSRLYLRARE